MRITRKSDGEFWETNVWFWGFFLIKRMVWQLMLILYVCIQS